MSKRIGFVDDNLNNFHANVYLKLIRGQLAERGFEVTGCFALQADAGQEWAAANGVPYCASVEELNACCDHFMVLAPGTPETHWALCALVLPLGKTTYVDKTFAPDLQTATQIFALADTHGVVVQTSSALRYTCLQEYTMQVGRDAIVHLEAWGGGRSFHEYAIHPVEIAVSCLGPGVTRLMRRGKGNFHQLLLEFTGERSATVNLHVGANIAYAATISTDTESKALEADTSTIFLNMADAILTQFETGQASVDRAESLAIRRILDAAANPQALQGFIPV